MKIQYCSDLHLEFPENKRFIEMYPLEVVGEILILAGDILPFGLHKKQHAFIDFVADNFEAVYWVPGNHEYYGWDISNVANPLMERLRSNVWIANNTSVVYKNISLICSTLWSKINPINELDIQRSVSDFESIKWHGEQFTTKHFNQLHHDAFSFIKEAIKKGEVESTLVISHHVPTLYHYPKQYRNSPINEAFAVELFDFIESSNVAYWIYGHHHCNTPSFKIGNTTMLTNQVGYVPENEHQLFNTSAIIEI